MIPAVTGAAIGLLGGLGLVLVVSRLRSRRITLDQRLAPYLRPQRTSSGLLGEPVVRGPLSTLERLAAPLMADGIRPVARVGSPTSDVRRRLVRAGRAESVEQFRAGQVVGGVLGLAAGLTLALGLAAGGRSATPALVVLVAVCGVVGLLARDWLLSRQVRAREARMLAELPTVAELIALASVGIALTDQGYDDDPAQALTITCSDDPCLAPGGDVEAQVQVVVPLPFVPSFVRDAVPLEVPVSATRAAPVDTYRAAGR